MAGRDDVTARIVAAQQRLQHLLAADPDNPLLRSTLTMQQLKVLLTISHTGTSSGQELAHAMGVSLATVTGLVDRLVAGGFVERREDPRDRRVRRLSLTDAGRATVDGIITAGRTGMLALLSRLSEDDLRVVERATVLLRDAAEAQLPGAAAAAPCTPPQPRRSAPTVGAPEAP